MTPIQSASDESTNEISANEQAVYAYYRPDGAESGRLLNPEGWQRGANDYAKRVGLKSKVPNIVRFDDDPEPQVLLERLFSYSDTLRTSYEDDAPAISLVYDADGKPGFVFSKDGVSVETVARDEKVFWTGLTVDSQGSVGDVSAYLPAALIPAWRPNSSGRDRWFSDHEWTENARTSFIDSSDHLFRVSTQAGRVALRDDRLPDWAWLKDNDLDGAAVLYDALKTSENNNGDVAVVSNNVQPPSPS